MAKDFEVNVDGLRLRESPKDGEIITVLEYGHPVEILKRQGGWSHVRTGVHNQSSEGYVAHKFLREIGKRPGFRLPSFGKPKITLDRMREFAGRASDDILNVLTDNLDDVLSEYGINKNPRRLAHFLAQLSHESAGFTALEENLNYSGMALWRVFRRHFKDQQEAESFARQPELIANRVYSNRMGNGPESSGDGFRYRGRGFIQLTGKNNYAHYGNLLGIDLLDEPFRASEPETALRLASAYWTENGLNKLADRNNLDAITRRINGGINGLQHRVEEFKRAASIWAAPSIGADGKPKKDRSGAVAIGTGAAGTGAAVTSGTDVLERESTEHERDVMDMVPALEREASVEMETDAPTLPEVLPGEDIVPEVAVQEPEASEPDDEVVIDESVVETQPQEDITEGTVPEPATTPSEEGASIPSQTVVEDEVSIPPTVDQSSVTGPLDEEPTVDEPLAEEPFVEEPVDMTLEEPASPEILPPPTDVPPPPDLDLPPFEETAPEFEPVEPPLEESPVDVQPEIETEPVAEILPTEDMPPEPTVPDTTQTRPDVPVVERPGESTQPILNTETLQDEFSKAAQPENTLEISTFILALIVVVLAVYLFFSRSDR